MKQSAPTDTVRLGYMHCPICGEFFGFAHMRDRRIDGGLFFCPLGHAMRFDPAEIQREIEVAELTRLYGPTEAPSRFAALRRLVNKLATKGTR